MEEKVSKFGEYGKVLSHGISPHLAGKIYHLSLENGNFIQISRNPEDGFRFIEYRPVEGKYIPISQGRVADLNWRKLLDTKL